MYWTAIWVSKFQAIHIWVVIQVCVEAHSYRLILQYNHNPWYESFTLWIWIDWKPVAIWISNFNAIQIWVARSRWVLKLQWSPKYCSIGNRHDSYAEAEHVRRTFSSCPFGSNIQIRLTWWWSNSIKDLKSNWRQDRMKLSLSLSLSLSLMIQSYLPIAFGESRLWFKAQPAKQAAPTYPKKVTSKSGVNNTLPTIRNAIMITSGLPNTNLLQAKLTDLSTLRSFL